MTALKVGIAGAGVFGTYHAQKAAASARADLVGVFDVSTERADKIARSFGRTAFDDFGQMLEVCDAVILAVPAVTHGQMVRQALFANCHVLVEKPLALNEATARSLAADAIARGRVLQVGHQERFVAKAMGIMRIEEPLLAMESVRASPPSPTGRAHDVSVIWDLMIHDFDLAGCLIPARFNTVSCQGSIAHSGKIDDATAEFTFRNGAYAKFRSSRAAEGRERTMRFVYESGEIAVDFLTRKMENTTAYDLIVDVSEKLPDPLGAADESFFAACLGQSESMIPGHGTISAISMAEKAEAKALAAIYNAQV